MQSPENGRKRLHKVEELAATLTTDGMNTAMTVIPPGVYIDRYPQHREAVEEAVARGVRYVVHHGHRRLAAARLAGLEDVPILVRYDVPSLRIAAIQENLQRMGLDPIEEGVEFGKALAEVDPSSGKALSQRELAARVGCSQTYVSQRVALLKLIPPLQAAVVNHWLKEQGLDPEGDVLIPVREAATVYARLRSDLQEAAAAGRLSPEDAAAICKLRADQQALPVPSDREPRADHAGTSPSAPPRQDDRVEPRRGTDCGAINPRPADEPPGVPQQRDDSSERHTDDPEAFRTVDEAVAATSPAKDPEERNAVAVAKPRIMEIRQGGDIGQLARALRETLTAPELEALREHLSQ